MSEPQEEPGTAAPPVPADPHRHSGAPAASRLAIGAAFLTIYLVWGSTYLAIRLAVETIPPFLMAGVRWLIAGVLMYAFARSRERIPLTRRNWLAAGVVGCLMLLGGNGLVNWAEQTVPSGLAALVIATVPLWMVLLDWLLFRGPRPTWTMAGGLLLGLAGICVLIGPQQFSAAPLNPAGGIALLAACVFWALGSLYSRRAALPKSNWLATAMEMLTASVVLLGLSAGLGEWGRVQWGRISLQSVLAVVYLVAFGSIVSLTAYKWLLKVVSAARVSTYAYVNPVIAMFLGAAVADEPLGRRVLIAAVIILASVVVITRAGTGRPAAGVRAELSRTEDERPPRRAEAPRRS